MDTAARERRVDRLNERLRGAQRVNIGDESFNLSLDGRPTVGPEGTPEIERESGGLIAQDLFALPSSTLGPTESVSGFSLTKKNLQEISDGRSRKSSDVASPSNATPLSRLRTSHSLLHKVQEKSANDFWDNALRQSYSCIVAGSANSPQRLKIFSNSKGAYSSSPARKNVGDSMSRALEGRNLTETSPVGSRNQQLENSPSYQHHEGKKASSPRSLPTTKSPDIIESAAEQFEKITRIASNSKTTQVNIEDASETISKFRKRILRNNSPECRSHKSEEVRLDEGHETILPKHLIRRRHHRDHPLRQRTGVRSKRKNQQFNKMRRKQTLNHSQAKHRRLEVNRNQDSSRDNVIEIMVQHFCCKENPQQLTDKLNWAFDEIVSSHHQLRESSLDVLAQICEEITQTLLSQFQQLANVADNKAGKRECFIKTRAIDAFRHQLASQFLEHALHLTHCQSMRKQLRHAQNERISLRDEIFLLQHEKEQVALRMDAARIKHEVENKGLAVSLVKPIWTGR